MNVTSGDCAGVHRDLPTGCARDVIVFQGNLCLKDNSGILNIEPSFWFVRDEIALLTWKFRLLVLSRVFG